MHLQSIAENRGEMLERVQEVFDVRHSAILFSLDEDELYRTLLSSNFWVLSGRDKSYSDQLAVITSTGIVKIFQHVEYLTRRS